MNIRKSLGIGAAPLALIGSVAMAHAADLAAVPIEPAAPIPYAFSWTGFYVGANIGYGFNGDDKVGIRNSFGFFDPKVATFKDSGIFGGVQAGYNYQWGSFVLGLEGDIQGSGISDKFSGAPEHFPGTRIPNGNTWSGKSEVNWFGTVRPRIGFAWDRALFYGTGGLAFGGVDYRLSGFTPGGVNFVNIKNDDTKVGWAAGAGIEYAFTDNWTVKLEYQYVNFGRDKVSAAQIGVPANVISSQETIDFHSVRLGVNYKF